MSRAYYVCLLGRPETDIQSWLCDCTGFIPVISNHFTGDVDDLASSLSTAIFQHGRGLLTIHYLNTSKRSVLVFWSVLQ